MSGRRFFLDPLWMWLTLGAGIGLVGLPVLAILSGFGADSGTITHLWQTSLGQTITTSLWLVIGVVPLVLLIGGGTAWAVTVYDFPLARLLRWALLLPLALPPYIVAYAYTDFLQPGGGLFEWTGVSLAGVRSLPSAILTLAMVLYPYAYLAGRAVFAQGAAAQITAARLLGCTGMALFMRVGLPMAWPALAAGAVLAAMEVLADFGTVSFFGLTTFTTSIYRSWFSLGDVQAAAYLSAWLLGFVAVCLAGEAWVRGRRRFTQADGPPLGRRPVQGSAAWLLTGVCLAPIILGFALPVGLLAFGAAQSGGAARGDLGMVIANTVLVSGLAAAIAVGLALMLGAVRRLALNPWMGMAVSVANFGYAIPGAVVAVGLLIPLTMVDYFLIDLVGGRTLWLTGSIVALVLAYQVRFLPLALRPLTAGWTAIDPAMDASARSLGAGPGRILTRLHLPLLTPSMGVAGLLVFVETIKELPATLILRPFNFDTLAVRAHHLAADERLAQAAMPSLLIALAGLVPIWILHARSERHAARPAPVSLPSALEGHP